VRDGAIVLMHDAAERGDREPVGPKALPRVLRAIADHNLTVVPLSAWLTQPDRALRSNLS
jgi:peptidoglycan/xylan/chitin deacetylase (PgdA/CDA1 family)